jgi:P4 family phage/plasmid primase-like protien
MSKPAGSFYIPVDEEATFFKLYKGALKFGEDLYLTEKHADLSPILIDIDLRFNMRESTNHVYTQEDVETIIRSYMEAIKENLAFTSATIYVLEKPSASIKKDTFKDGLHIVIPDIVARPAVHYIIRTKAMELLADLFKTMGATNDISDIIDERVLEINPWQMYGSKKPSGDPYAITSIYTLDNNPDNNSIMTVCTKTLPNYRYVEVMSIRNKYRETPLRNDRITEIEAFETSMYDEREKKKCVSHASQTTRNTTKTSYPYLGLVNALVHILNPDRANSWDTWIRLGWCLRTIDNSLLPLWIEFSRNSPKFMEGDCEMRWDYMRDEGLNIGTLHMWARTDNPKAYSDAITKDLSELLKASLAMSHYDIAKVVHHMYQHQYVCVSIKQKQWYEFRDHRWNHCDGGYTLRNKISVEVYNEYTKLSTWFNTQSLAAEPGDQAAWTAKSAICGKIALKLKDTGFKESIMKECADMFFVPKFEEKLDSRLNLIGFKDGVLELDTMEFREGHPEDLISFSTNTNYREYSESDPYNAPVMEFINSILPKEDMRDYVLKVLSSCLDGAVREERFHIWTGVGSNGKSKMLELLLESLGDYFCNMSVTAVTGKRVSSDGTNSELVRSKGKRALVLQEPGDNEKLNMGWVKELTGGDRIIARGLFKEPIEFKPQFKMFLICNHLPAVPPEDGGTWRRIRVVEFTSRFCENPDPTKPNEFPMDGEISSKFMIWKETFMAILIEYYRRYREEGSADPEDVMECTRQYQKANDAMGQYMDDRVEKDDAGFITVAEIYKDCSQWIRESNPGIKVPRQSEAKTYFEKRWGKVVRAGTRTGWKGLRLRGSGFVEEGIDEDDNS